MYMYRYWVNILANINVYWGCVSRSIHIYWGCVLGADVQYICPTHIRCHPIHQYIPNTCRCCPTHIVVVQYMWKSVLQDTNVPQHMWKYVLDMCVGSHLYTLLGSYTMFIGYISWITFVLPNTHEKMLSNVHGELPNTYTQCTHRVPNIYLGWILTLTHMCIVQHHMCISSVYRGAMYWATSYMYWVCILGCTSCMLGNTIHMYWGTLFKNMCIEQQHVLGAFTQYMWGCWPRVLETDTTSIYEYI